MKKLKISRLTPDSRYLQTVALNLAPSRFCRQPDEVAVIKLASVSGLFASLSMRYIISLQSQVHMSTFAPTEWVQI